MSDIESRKAKWIAGLSVGAVAVVTITLLLVFLLPQDADPKDAPMGVYSKAAVSANGYLCAPIGKDIFLEGGNAVEAAIATLLCEGVLNAHSMGVGGGFLATIYIKETGEAVVMNARESAPAKADKDMYNGNSTLSLFGGLSVAVPGELRGYQEMFDRYKSGNIAWKRLFDPAVKICRDGQNVTDYLANTIKSNEADIRRSPDLMELLTNKETGELVKAGDVLKFEKLADTLELVSNSTQRADVIYNGLMTESLVQDIQDAGGIITKEDLNNYKVQWQEPIKARIKNHTMYSVPLPGSGPILAFILNIIDDLLPGPDQVVSTQRLIEALKFAYGKRTELGDFTDPGYVPDVEEVKQLLANLTSPAYAEYIRTLIHDNSTQTDPKYYGAVFDTRREYGTAHVSVLGPNGDAVSVTSTVNQIYGAQIISKSTGIILNDEMDDFSAPNITNGFGLPPSPANFIFPGKRPLSSMVPSVFVDPNGDVSLVTGAAGGSKITTVTAQLAINSLIYGMSIKEALDAVRVHHQLIPMYITYEADLDKDIVAGLSAIGHNMTSTKGIATATGIGRQGANVTACYDRRRGGSVDGI